MVNYSLYRNLLLQSRSLHISPVKYMNLIGRSYLTPKDFTLEETRSILWTAADLKHLFKNKCCEFKNIENSRITLLLERSLPEIQAATYSAASLLKSHLNVIVDPKWDSATFINDMGSFFSTCTDMILCQTKYQSKMKALVKGSVVPVVNVSSCSYRLLDVLADIMAVQQKYNHLRNITIAWIGAPCPTANTYLIIAPKFGINMQYCCTCASGSQMSPVTLPQGEIYSKKMRTALIECKTPCEAISSAHVIALAKHGVKDYKITLDVIKEKANRHWSLLHILPRSSVEVDPVVFEHENSLVWEAKGNLQWICAALMVIVASDGEKLSLEEFDVLQKKFTVHLGNNLVKRSQKSILLAKLFDYYI